MWWCLMPVACVLSSAFFPAIERYILHKKVELHLSINISRITAPLCRVVLQAYLCILYSFVLTKLQVMQSASTVLDDKECVCLT